MSRKGFTLVELLAVIAILGLIVVLAVPNVMNMFNNAKKTAFKADVQMIFRQAQTDFVSDSFNVSGPKWYCKDGTGSGNSVDDCKELKIVTNLDYAVCMYSDGNLSFISAKDDEYVYSLYNHSYSITISDIREDDIKPANDYVGEDSFKIWQTIVVIKDADSGVGDPQRFNAGKKLLPTGKPTLEEAPTGEYGKLNIKIGEERISIDESKLNASNLQINDNATFAAGSED